MSGSASAEPLLFTLIYNYVNEIYGRYLHGKS